MGFHYFGRRQRPTDQTNSRLGTKRFRVHDLKVARCVRFSSMRGRCWCTERTAMATTARDSYRPTHQFHRRGIVPLYATGQPLELCSLTVILLLKRSPSSLRTACELDRVNGDTTRELAACLPLCSCTRSFGDLFRWNSSW